MAKAIETTATVGNNRQLTLDEDLPKNTSVKVRVIVLIDDIDKNGEIGTRRKAGSAKGMIKMADDFDAPLEDFEEYQP